MDAEFVTGVSVIISIIALIVFFVMASNIGKLVSEIRASNVLLKRVTEIQLGEINGTLKNVVCGNCNKSFKTFDATSFYCPHCKSFLKERPAETKK